MSGVSERILGWSVCTVGSSYIFKQVDFPFSYWEIWSQYEKITGSGQGPASVSRIVLLSPVYSEFTLGGIQGKPSKLGNPILCEKNRLVRMMVASAWRQLFQVMIFLFLSHPSRMKCPLASTNKRFLINTIKNTLPSHKEQDHEQKEGNKEPAKDQDEKEANSKQHRSHAHKRSWHSRSSSRHSPPHKRRTKDKHEARASRRWGRPPEATRGRGPWEAGPAPECAFHCRSLVLRGCGWPAKMTLSEKQVRRSFLGGCSGKFHYIDSVAYTSTVFILLFESRFRRSKSRI